MASAPATRLGRQTTVTLVACLSMLALPGSIQAQPDDFNDGNDDGWSPYAPLAALGIPTVIAVENNRYRIQTTAPTGSESNPGRAGSLRMDVSYSDFYVAADVVGWLDTTRQAFGLLGRINTPGLGQTAGYAFTYERGSGVTPTSGDMDISRLDGEAPTSIHTGASAIHLDPAKTYRFVFIGKGPYLEGRVYELPNTRTPLITISASDGQYAAGACGLVVYDNSGGNGVTDATFDNYLALPEEPPVLTLAHTPGDLPVRVSWPISFTGYRLEWSPVLPAMEWTEEGNVVADATEWYFVGDADSGNKFFRLHKPPEAFAR
jgi:hypothetical protein